MLESVAYQTLNKHVGRHNSKLADIIQPALPISCSPLEACSPAKGRSQAQNLSFEIILGTSTFGERDLCDDTPTDRTKIPNAPTEDPFMSSEEKKPRSFLDLVSLYRKMRFQRQCPLD